MPDSSTTSSAAKICASQRTASAIASDGRESISTSVPSWTIVIRAKYVFSRSSVTVTLTTSPLSSETTSVSRSCVIGRCGLAPCSFIRIAAASGWPIQIGRKRSSSTVFKSTIGCLPIGSKLTP